MRKCKSSHYDVCVAGSCGIPSRGKGTMEIERAVSLPPGTYAWIAPYLGLAIKNFIDVGAGIVHLGYWGKIKVVLFNHLTKDFAVQVGDWIA